MESKIVNILPWSVINKYDILNSIQSNLAKLELACTQSDSANLKQVRISVQSFWMRSGNK